MLPPLLDPRWRRGGRLVARLAVGAVIVLALVWFRQPILAGYARGFRVDDPAPSDAIVLLLGGIDHRPERAASLWREGVAPIIVFAQSLETGASGADESTETLRLLRRAGVPSESIVMLPGVSMSTRDEARHLRVFARDHPMRRITLVTTAFHTARARWIFRKVLRGTGIEIHVAAAKHPLFDEENWYTADEGLLCYLVETVKTVYYRLAY